ncbi:MAG TPA: cation diffusion facilitator family transporter [Bryobacteraceae bacterium]|jgi:cation diffusion facilitator family transporter
MASQSKIAVLAALGGDLAVTVTKFVAAAITGSAAMWSEGIHSAADSSNQVLLLIGMRRSKRRSDTEHPFGHGKELYFWSLLVAVLIFGGGGGVSVYEGILRIRKPIVLGDPKWSYIVLGCALVFESISLAVALRAFLAESGHGNILNKITTSKNPATYTVVAEDTAAIAGIFVAAAGVFFSHYLKIPIIDGVASVIIGLLLATVATFLIRESRGLLVGEGVNPKTEEEIRQIASKGAPVNSISRPLTMYLGPSDVLLILDVRFNSAANISDVAEEIERMKSRIRERFPELRKIYIDIDSAPTEPHT